MSSCDHVEGSQERLASTCSTLNVDWKPSSSVRVLFNTQDGTTQYCIEVTECCNIGSIKRFCKATKPWERISLTFEGRKLEDEKTLIECDIHSGDTVTFIYQVDSDDSMVPIFLKSYIPEFVVYVNTSITVENLKKLLHFRYGFPLVGQRLLYAGKQLEDDRQLSQYYISTESTIHLVLTLRGGGYRICDFEFTNVEINPFNIRQWSSDKDPSYMKFSDGVNSEGFCNNPDCSVYCKKFVCQHGYGIYRVKEDPTRCPVCQRTSLRVESFGFSRANVIVRAMPLGLKDQPAEIRSDLSENNGNYAYLQYFVLKSSSNDLVLNTSSNDNKNYEFIEVYSCKPPIPVTMGKQLCLLCSRTIQGSDACTHGLPDIERLSL